MKGSSPKQFGLVVAYVLPGFIALAGMTPLLPGVANWLHPVDQGDLGLGPPLYAVLGATAMGLLLSCFRWLVLDHLHQWTGVARPAWDDRRLDDVLGGFDYLVQSHYRYYEFCGNTLLAALWAYGVNRFWGTLPYLGLGTDLGMIILVLVLFTASRDALAKYYSRTRKLIGSVTDLEFFPGGLVMYNGNDHGAGTGGQKQPRPENKPQQEPRPPAKPQPANPKGTESDK